MAIASMIFAGRICWSMLSLYFLISYSTYNAYFLLFRRIALHCFVARWSFVMKPLFHCVMIENLLAMSFKYDVCGSIFTQTFFARNFYSNINVFGVFLFFSTIYLWIWFMPHCYLCCADSWNGHRKHDSALLNFHWAPAMNSAIYLEMVINGPTESIMDTL
jgi:hypothetical protein